MKNNLFLILAIGVLSCTNLKTKEEIEAIAVETTDSIPVAKEDYQFNCFGIPWASTHTTVISRMKELGYVKYHDTLDDDEGLIYLNVIKDGVKFDGVRFKFIVSNRRNYYLSEIIFGKALSDLAEAEAQMKSIGVGLSMLSKQHENAKFEIRKDDAGLDNYVVLEENGGYNVNRINLYIQYSKELGYCVMLVYNGILAAGLKVREENEKIEQGY